MLIEISIAIITWKRDAQVLIKTCPVWGNLVDPLKYPNKIPINAGIFVNKGSSMKPIWIPAFGKLIRTSPK